MILKEDEIRSNTIIEVAKQMMLSARTAPKAKGMDTLDSILITGEDLKTLAEEMERQAEKLNKPFFVRDAKNILQSDAVVLVGTKDLKAGLNCGYCGFSTCAECTSHEGSPCVFTSVNMGIALGSAVSLGANLHVDSRILFSAGWAAKALGWMPQCGFILAIPLAAASKSPYFDR